MYPSDADVIRVTIITVASVLGLLIGSFLNVVIYRVPLGLSIVKPPSACPGCGAHIEARDNIPLISWLVLRGKCRHCGNPISIRYPIVELITGVLFAATALLFVEPVATAQTTGAAISASLVLVAFLYFAAIAVALVGIDLDVHRLPNVIIYPSYIVFAVLFSGAAIASGSYDALIRAGLGAVILFVAYFAMAYIKPGGMGFGDIKLAAIMGACLGWLGWGSLLVGAFGAFVLGGIFSIILLISRRANRSSGIPFGPWMFAGAYLGISVGERLWQGYLALVGLA